MAGTDSDAPFQRIQELEEEIQVLRERLEQADEDNDRLRREIERLRRELKAAGRGESCRKRKRKRIPSDRAASRGEAALRFDSHPPTILVATGSYASRCLSGSINAPAAAVS